MSKFGWNFSGSHISTHISYIDFLTMRKLKTIATFGGENHPHAYIKQSVHQLNSQETTN